jgi:hypothetical protein
LSLLPLPLAAEWTPEQVRGDGGKGDYRSNAQPSRPLGSKGAVGT